MYVYKLPYKEWSKLCQMVEGCGRCAELARYMGFGPEEVESLGKAKAPAEELLTKWGNYNHTVDELFILMSRMHLYQAMRLLQPFVDQKFHKFIPDKEDNLAHIVDTFRDNVVVTGTPAINFERGDDKVVNNKILFNGNKEIVEKAHNNLPVMARSPLPTTSRLPLTASGSTVAETASSIPQIPYEELEKATNNWDDKVVLGKGGFGKVYLGMWKRTRVAVKRLEMRDDSNQFNSERIRQLVTELHCLNAYRHDNVLPLYGYSAEGPYPCLIYQYMAGGSLDKRLHTPDTKDVLSYVTRLNIAIGVARGLQFLHTSLYEEKPLIHGDIKSANILLDPSNQPKIGDFGLARLGPPAHRSAVHVTRVHGTLPYLPQEFLRSHRLSPAVDAYAFGVVVMETATARPPFCRQRKRFLRDDVTATPSHLNNTLRDPKAPPGHDYAFDGLIEIGRVCVAKLPKERPNMVQVLGMLEEIQHRASSNI